MLFRRFQEIGMIPGSCIRPHGFTFSGSFRFFLGFGCGAVPMGLISQCAAIWIRTAKMNVAGEHMGFVSDSHVHSLWRVGSKADTGYQALRHGHTPKAEKEPHRSRTAA